MMPKRTPSPEEITSLLFKLREETPEYPADQLAARKGAFLKQVGTINIQGKGQGGGQAGNGGPATPGGGLPGPGFLLQALIGIGLIAALLSAALVYRDQINDLLARNENKVVTVEDTPIPTGISTGTALATSSSLPPTTTSTPVPPTGTATGFPTTVNGTPLIGSTPVIVDTPDGTQGNNGLHLGQTPGTPAAPGQGNPGNPNQPDDPGNGNSGNGNSGNGNSGNGNSGNGNSGNGNAGGGKPK
jgi:hypothetical protein